MRIFDTFPFDGELDLLRFRLEERFEDIDAFVLVEAGETYRGAPKPLTYDAARGRFAWASGKIRHVKVPRLGGPETSPRERAARQRNAIRAALRDADPEDVVLLLDVDEIPSASLIARLRREGAAVPRRLRMTRHFGFADLVAPRSPCCPTGIEPFPAATRRIRPGAWTQLSPAWHSHSGVAAAVRDLRSRSAFELRFGTPLDEPLPDAGRHFTSVDPAARLERKLGRVFHDELDGRRERSPLHLARCRAHGVHHRGWWYAERPSGALPPDVARLVQNVPTMAAPPLPPALARRLVRSWAWLRLWRALPDGLVASVDRRFERLRPLLAPPLLLLDAGRACLAAGMRAAGLAVPPRNAGRH
jgi:beta-1,4-mannosyl-glycoprotein beta-1,4-N-acetylglucosaminyltransferase